MSHLVAIYRSPSYSPLQHRVNDTAILDATVSRLEGQGWWVTKTTELEVERGLLPAAELYLNMCQGSLAAEQLMPLESDGAVVVNRPSSALDCHRYRLVKRLGDSTLPFPRTLILATAAPPPPPAQLAGLSPHHQDVWVKRGDVHAMAAEDVIPVRNDQVVGALAQFASRGIRRVAVQEHVRGPVLKFYGVTQRRFFRFYDAKWGPGGPAPVVDEARLRAVAFDAADRLRLQVFGGDVALPAPDRPVLIDLNDWPSFTSCRADAAGAIADYVHTHARHGVARRISDS